MTGLVFNGSSKEIWKNRGQDALQRTARARPVPLHANKERGNMEFSIFYQELQNSTEMIRALLAGVEPEAARLKPSAEAWSILEVVCHLYDEEREDFREHLDFILSISLKTGLPRQNEEWHVIDTEGWVTQRKYNEQNFAEMREKFFVEREKSFAWLHGLQDPDWEKTYTTPYRTISAGEMFACWVAHDNLHIRQLVELRRMRLENITKPYNLEYAGDW
jgi:DinB family protein